MRVLHVIPSVAAVRGGPSQAVLELTAAAHQAGGNDEILTTNDDGPGVLNVPLGELTEYQGSSIRFFPRWSPHLRPVREFAYSEPLARWLRQHVKDYDLIHVHALFSYASSAAMRIARQAAVPYIVRPSGLLCRWSLRQSWLRKKLFLTLFDRVNLNGSAAIEYTAEQEQEEAGDLGLKAPGFVMPYGLWLPQMLSHAREELRRRLGLREDEPVILFLSRLHPKKGVQHLFPAVRSLIGRRFTLVIAGTGAADYEVEMRGLAAAHAPTERVRFVGFASGEWKQVLLQGADVFVLPSYSESFAIAVMEALAVGVPVITTPGVPLSLLVRKFDLGWICEPEPAGLATALEKALNSVADHAEAQARGERARRLIAHNFAWPTIAGRLRAVYEAVLHGQSLPSYELDRMSL